MLHLDDALTLLDRADDAAAADVLGTLAVETPVHATVHVLLAQACERLHRWDDALSAWQTARLLLPDLVLVQQGTLRAAQVLAALQTLRAPEPFPPGDDDAFGGDAFEADDRPFSDDRHARLDADDSATGLKTDEAAPDLHAASPPPASAVFVDDPRDEDGPTPADVWPADVWPADSWPADSPSDDPYAALRHPRSAPSAPPVPVPVSVPVPTTGTAGAMGAGGVGAPPMPDPQADPYASAHPSHPQAAASRVADPYRADPYASPIADPYAAPLSIALPVAPAPAPPVQTDAADDAPRATPEAGSAGASASAPSLFFDPLADAIHARPLDDPRPVAPRPSAVPMPAASTPPVASSEEWSVGAGARQERAPAPTVRAPEAVPVPETVPAWLRPMTPEPPEVAPLWDVPRLSAAPLAPPAPLSPTRPPLSASPPSVAPAPAAWPPPVPPPVQAIAPPGGERAAAPLPTFGPPPSGARLVSASPSVPAAPPIGPPPPPEIVPAAPIGAPIDAPRLPGVPPAFDLDDLIESLRSAGRIVPHDDPNASPTPEGLDADDADEVVSPTLARIFAAQGQYADAIRAYERLAAADPARAADFLAEADALRTRSR